MTRRKSGGSARTPALSPRIVLALAAAFLLSGGAALIHEVVWVRLLGLVFGATSLAVSTVLATFMAGLALGSYWFGRLSSRVADRRRLYAVLEIGIGVFALLVPSLLEIVEPLYGWVWRSFEPSTPALLLVRFLAAAVILIVPTTMMGATFPVLAEHLSRANVGRGLAPEWLYTLNLLGAVLGAAATGFVLMPILGVSGTIWFGAGLNAAIGLGVLLLPSGRDRAPVAAATQEGREPRVDAALGFAAFASGALSLATQVAWTRVLSLIVGSTTYAFSAVLVVYLVALGAGSALAARLGARRASMGTALAWVYSLLGVTLLAALTTVNRLPYWYLWLNDYWSPSTLAGTITMKVSLIFVVLFVPVLVAGTILPLCLMAGVAPEARGTGAVVGRLYAVNTLGSIVGALASGFFLIPSLGPQVTLLAVCAIAVILGLAFWLRYEGSTRALVTVVTALALVFGGVLTRRDWNYLELHAGVYEPGRIVGTVTDTLTEEGEETLFHREGPSASVIVVRRPSGVRTLIINGRVNASDTAGDMSTQILLAQVPLLFAPRSDDVFILGWGSGVTAGSAAASSAGRVTVVEMEPAVVEASEHFRHVNLDPLRNPRVRLFEEDARHVLQASEDEYDVMVSEPSQLWVSGVANVFTEDFYRLAAKRLRVDGVFMQWIQLYQISLDVFRSAVASFQAVFPEVLAFRAPGSLDVLLLGARQPLRIDLDELERRWAEPGTRRELARIGLRRPGNLLGSLLLGPEIVRSLVAEATINTDDNMYVEFRAPTEMARGMAESSQVKVAVLQRLATPVESLLTRPASLLENRERLEALIEGLRLAGREHGRYSARLQDLR